MVTSGAGVIASELRALLKERAETELDPAAFPHLIQLAASRGLDTPAIRAIDLQELLDQAVANVPDDIARQSLEALLGSGSLRFRSVKERATSAARNSGVSYDAYRRKDTGRMSTDLHLLAQQLACATPAERVNTEQANAGLPPDTPGTAPPGSLGDGSRRRSVAAFAVAVIALSALGIGALVMRRGDDGPTVAAEPLTESTIEPSSTTSADPAAKAATPAAEVALDTTGESGCVAPGDTSRSDDQTVAAAAAVAARSGDAPADACGAENLIKRGDVYWQRFILDDRLIGGFIAYEFEGETRAMFLNLGQWQSYMRVGGGDGSRSSNMAGFPTGELVPIGDLTSLAVTGDALLTAEDPEGTYYWMPKVASEVWLAQGAGEGPLGDPTSSVYITDGAFRVDFERGYLEQLMDGRLDDVLVDDVTDGLPALDEMSGHLISAFDGTGWLIDDDGRRWWIPDGERWDCAGGTDNMVASGLPGYAIHSLPYGGVATCP